MRQLLLDIRDQINTNTVLVNDPITTLLQRKNQLNKISVKKYQNEPQTWICELNRFYSALYPTTSPHGNFSKTDHMLVYKTCLNKYKIMEITLGLLLDYYYFNKTRNQT